MHGGLEGNKEGFGDTRHTQRQRESEMTADYLFNGLGLNSTRS